MARFYKICENFIGHIYFLIFKREAPTFLPESRNLIATMVDWYVGESFAYIRIWGSNTTRMLPKVVPDSLVIEEISFQIVTEGVYKNLVRPKRRVWPKFLQNLGP